MKYDRKMEHGPTYCLQYCTQWCNIAPRALVLSVACSHMLISALFLIYWQVRVVGGPGGHVSLLFHAFSNPSNLLLSGDCCDPACADCNYYFLFCIRDQPSSPSCLVSGKTKTYNNYKHLVFTYGDSLGNGWQNPVGGSFRSWKVR